MLKPGEYVPEALARAARAPAKAAADAAVRENRHVPFQTSTAPRTGRHPLPLPKGTTCLRMGRAHAHRRRPRRRPAGAMDVDGVAGSIYDPGWEGTILTASCDSIILPESSLTNDDSRSPRFLSVSPSLRVLPLLTLGQIDLDRRSSSPLPRVMVLEATILCPITANTFGTAITRRRGCRCETRAR